MNKQEYINLGGRAEDYEKAVKIYSETEPLWGTQAEFAAAYTVATDCPKGWAMVVAAANESKGLATAVHELFTRGEITRRLLGRLVETLEQRESELTENLAKTKRELKELRKVVKALETKK